MTKDFQQRLKEIKNVHDPLPKRQGKPDMHRGVIDGHITKEEVVKCSDKIDALIKDYPQHVEVIAETLGLHCKSDDKGKMKIITPTHHIDSSIAKLEWLRASGNEFDEDKRKRLERLRKMRDKIIEDNNK